jgi:hypothetical protein
MSLRSFLRREWFPLAMITFWAVFWLAVFVATFQ